MGLLVAAPLSGAPVAGADPVTLTVAVTNQSGDPVSGADLTATWDGGSATAETRANGKAFVDVPEGADVEIEVDHPVYVRNHPVVVENADEREVSIDVFQRGSATIAVEDDTGHVSDARVILRKRGRIVADGQTTDDGTYETDVIERGEYSVTVIKRGYFRQQQRLTVDGNVETTVPIERGTVTLQVRVTDPHFDPPRAVGDLTVAIESVGQIQTRPDGTASVGVPVNADLDVTVTGDEYEEVTRTVSVEESDVNANVSVSRTPQLTLETANERVIVDERTVVTVRNEYDEPVEGATVLLDDEAVGETDANGQLSVTISGHGEHALRAEANGLRSDSVTVTGVDVDGETPTATATTTTAESGPGFTLLASGLALFALAGLLARRQ